MSGLMPASWLRAIQEVVRAEVESVLVGVLGDLAMSIQQSGEHREFEVLPLGNYRDGFGELAQALRKVVDDRIGRPAPGLLDFVGRGLCELDSLDVHDSSPSLVDTTPLPTVGEGASAGGGDRPPTPPQFDAFGVRP